MSFSWEACPDAEARGIALVGAFEQAHSRVPRCNVPR